MAVPMADPESLATGGTKTSEKRPESTHSVFQSQLRPHPPAMTSGRPLTRFCSAKRRNTSKIASL